jgi:hypothetical protein
MYWQSLEMICWHARAVELIDSSKTKLAKSGFKQILIM